MADYVNNARLREVVIEYNNNNIYDTGEWCSGYSKRMRSKFDNEKLSDEKFSLSKSFINDKIKRINELQERYSKMTDEEKREHEKKLMKIKEELTEYVSLMVQGRIVSFKLFNTLRNKEDIDDISQDAIITVYTYINRYDESRCSSAFSFITQLITNSILLSLGQIKDRDEQLVTGLEHFDNLRASDENTSIHNFT